ADVNQLVDTKKINEYVLVAEALHEKKLARIADMITEHPRHPRIILLSGPSSSGKTTTVKRLSVQLRVNGMRPLVIGLDDFFVERERTPKDETGEYDFESFQAIDVALLQDCVRKILRNGEVRLPHFDFIQGKPVPGELVQLQPGQPLILEGIHALNPDLLPEIPDGLKFKIFISPLTHLNIDDHNRIGSGDTRLIRRLVRDSRYRGYDGVATLTRWPSVRRGEEKNILPYQDNADIIFNSSLPYEVLILKQHAMQVLQNVPREHPIYSEAARLIKFMSYYRNINPDIVPRHSLLREFIGGSSFKY
ncbi:MAG TPA: nucleoside kinase, partial [Candidatus Sumerlaeota bacterium]|nr:nucleoside kinase [Candidatus Sumerlaeota bacterium]